MPSAGKSLADFVGVDATTFEVVAAMTEDNEALRQSLADIWARVRSWAGSGREQISEVADMRRTSLLGTEVDQVVHSGEMSLLVDPFDDDLAEDWSTLLGTASVGVFDGISHRGHHTRARAPRTELNASPVHSSDHVGSRHAVP